MLRAILGVIFGYIVMVIVVVMGFTALQLVLGTETVFKPASWEPSTLFIACALVLSIVAAVIGGLACAVIATSGKPVKVLAGVVLVLGIVNAVTQMGLPAPAPRPAEVTPMDAGKNARSPMWYNFTLPVIGVAGVLIAGALRKQPSRP